MQLDDSDVGYLSNGDDVVCIYKAGVCSAADYMKLRGRSKGKVEAVPLKATLDPNKQV